MSIAPSGLLQGGSAVLEAAGDWDNAGTFDAGTSTVQLGDGCGLLSATVSGGNSFSNLEMKTDARKLFRFTAGSTQTITNAFPLLGAPDNRLQIRSILDGSAAFVQASGSSSAQFVDGQDNDASGANEMAIGLNSLKGPNTPGWSFSTLVPALGPLALVLLALTLVWRGRRALALPPGGFARRHR